MYSDCRIISATPIVNVPAATVDTGSEAVFKPRQAVKFLAAVLDTFIAEGDIVEKLQLAGGTVDAESEWLGPLKPGDLLKLVQQEEGIWKVIGAECG